MNANDLLQEVIRIPCDLSAVYSVRRAVRDVAEDAGLPASTVDDVVLAVSEASTNAVRYGCPYATSEVEVRWRNDGSCIEIAIADDGIFRKRVPIPGIDESRGRGIPLMIALMDEVHIREGTERSPGTTVRMLKCVEE